MKRLTIDRLYHAGSVFVEFDQNLPDPAGLLPRLKEWCVHRRITAGRADLQR